MSESTASLPAHHEETVDAISKLHSDHRRGSSGLQRLSEWLCRFFSQPRSIAVVTLGILAWLAVDALMALVHLTAFDPWPLSGLQALTSVTALYMTLFILSGQRREDELSELRDQLTLQMAIVSEQKIAKVIELMEELRRDLPSVRDRNDPSANELSKPADPDAVLEVLKERQEDLREAVSPEPPKGGS